MNKGSVLEVIDELLGSYRVLENELGKVVYLSNDETFGTKIFADFYNTVSNSLELCNLERELEIWQASDNLSYITFDDSLELILRNVKSFLLSVRTRFTEGGEGALISIEQFDETRGYLKRLVEEINGCFSAGYYDACLVMIRRIIETLIIECFESKNIESKIKNDSGNFVYLTEMLPVFFGEDKGAWNLSRNNIQNTIKDLVLLKCHPAAHHRSYISRLSDIQRFESSLNFFISDAIRIAFD
jgi:hypothetical protein